MREAVVSFLVAVIFGIAQGVSTGAANAQQKPTKNLACSETVQPSGFTECEELRLQVSLSQLQQLKQMGAEVAKKAQEFIDAVVAEHPGMQYVTAQMQTSPQAQQAFAQQFPYGAIRPIPKPEPPAKPADAKPVQPSAPAVAPVKVPTPPAPAKP